MGRGAKRTREETCAGARGAGHSSDADDSCVLPPELNELRQTSPLFVGQDSGALLSGDKVRNSSRAARARCPSTAAADATPDALSHALFSGRRSLRASLCTRRERRANRNGDNADASNNSARDGVRAQSASPGITAETTAATACGTCSITRAPVSRPTRAARDSSLYRNSDAFDIRHLIDVILDP